MKTTVRRWTLGVLVGVWVASPASSWAQGIPVVDAASIVEAVQQTAAMAKDYAAQIQMLETQVSSMKSLTTGLGSSLNVDPTASIQQGLNTIKQGGSSISGGSAAISGRLNSVFGESGSSTVTDQTAVMKATEDTVRGAALLTGQQQDALPADAVRINNLATQSQSATTALGAQQAGNQINAEIANQLLQARANQSAQDAAANTMREAQIQEKKQQKAVTEMFFGAN